MRIDRVLILLCVLCLWCGGMRSSCQAQTPQSTTYQSDAFSRMRPNLYSKPTVSPYLNLLRSGSSVYNYYGLVRPEIELRRADSQLRSSFGRMEERLGAVEGMEVRSQLSKTGHSVRFMTDLRGGVGSVSEAAKLGRSTTGDNKELRLGSSGHGAYFGNNGLYYYNR